MRGRSTVLIVIALCVAALVGCYMFNYPVYTYRYRLTINIELDGKVHSGSSVIEIGWQEGIKLGDAGGFAPLIRGQAAIVDLSDRGVVIATLITGEGYGTAGDGALAAISIVPRAFGKASTAEQIQDLPNLRGKRNLEANDLPRFLWLSSKDDVTTARKLHVQGSRSSWSVSSFCGHLRRDHGRSNRDRHSRATSMAQVIGSQASRT